MRSCFESPKQILDEVKSGMITKKVAYQLLRCASKDKKWHPDEIFAAKLLLISNNNAKREMLLNNPHISPKFRGKLIRKFFKTPQLLLRFANAWGYKDYDMIAESIDCAATKTPGAWHAS
ncbi:MAG: hypothetical protein P0S95_05505 [Rhabdochlamydiaceae bacterium]|nr:hypothetical protein [Candidatus Amphrikana amoebophyrae]